jgi:plastocyanin
MAWVTTMKRIGRLVAVGVLAFGAPVSEAVDGAGAPTTRAVFMSAIEVKGATTIDRLAPPPADPHLLSAGYGFKAPSDADTREPGKWEVSSYMFVPSFITVRQGDRLELTVFVVNGDAHAVRITDPGGRDVAAVTVWNRGREYKIAWVAEKPGPYELTCLTHAPTMSATFLVLPRP